MYKEAGICIITIIGIIFLNIITGNYTSDSVQELTGMLSELREDFFQNEDNIKNEQTINKVNQIHEAWFKRYNILAYYLEHDELEKVANNLTALKSSIDTEEFNEAVSELDESVFVLKHIEEKNSFDWKNIF